MSRYGLIALNKEILVLALGGNAIVGGVASKVIAAGASFVLLGLRDTSAEIKKASHIHLGNPGQGREEYRCKNGGAGG